MRRVILHEFVSLDALAAGPIDSVDFIPASTRGDESFGPEQMVLINSIDTLLLGSVTYRLFAGYWPNVKEGKEKAFADKFNAAHKIVFSKTLDKAPWGTWEPATIVRNSAADEVPKLKRKSGKDMVIFGSISVAQALMAERMIDEYRLVVCPVVLGSGRPLFADNSRPLNMQLMSGKVLDRGGVLLKYSDRDAKS
ncbi:MAG TPA: dihydrofolate reductase family protein [Thermoanaerobaculia bacterium]|nr:dihydrofolate reductase family protein [Thermoanaerobaculia bacterium]